MIVVTGSVTVRTETFDEARRLSLEHVHRSRQEPGCISHGVHVDCENPLRLVFFEQWADRAATRRPLCGTCIRRVRAHLALAGHGADHARPL